MKFALILWSASMFSKVYDDAIGWLTPSTVRSEITQPSSGVMVKVLLSPYATVMIPTGSMVPLFPAVAVMVPVQGTNTALMV